MGGAQFFWRVTLHEGKGKEGIFVLEEYSLPLGKPRPSIISYQVKKQQLTYAELIANVPFIGNEVDQEVLALSPEKRQAEFYYTREMSV